MRGPLCDVGLAAGPLGAYELARLVDHDFAARDLRLLRERSLEPLVAHPIGATRVDSSTCAEVSKKPTELMTP